MVSYVDKIDISTEEFFDYYVNKMIKKYDKCKNCKKCLKRKFKEIQGWIGSLYKENRFNSYTCILLVFYSEMLVKDYGYYTPYFKEIHKQNQREEINRRLGFKNSKGNFD